MKKYLFLSFVFALACPHIQAQTLLAEVKPNDFDYNTLIQPIFAQDAGAAMFGGSMEYNCYVAQNNKVVMYGLKENTKQASANTGIDSHKKDIAQYGLTKEGETLASVGNDNTIKVWSSSLMHIATIQETPTEAAYMSGMGAVALSPKDLVVAYARYSEDGSATLIKLYNYLTKKEVAVFKNPTKELLRKLVYSTDGKYLFGYSNTKLTVWEVATGNVTDMMEGKNIAYAGYIATANSYIVQSNEKLYKRSTKGIIQLTFVSGFKDNNLTSYAVSADGKYVYGAKGSTFIKWDATSGKELEVKEYTGIFIPNYSLLLPDGKTALIMNTSKMHQIDLVW